MTKKHPVLYVPEPDLDVAEFRRVLIESGLGASRPIDDEARLRAMLTKADLIVTARLEGADGRLVGVARCVTDFSWCCYLSELAVSPAARGLGIGRGLIDAVRQEIGPTVSLILASVPASVSFYERIGMPRMPDVFWFRRER